MTQGFLLEVRIGVGEPAAIALVPGTPLDPTSFGRAAMWRIGAEGVLDIHGYVYFDGGSVFVQSADDQFPVVVNRRHRVSTAWTEVRAPSTLHVGQAQIVLKATDTLARSGALVAVRPQDMQPGPSRAPEPPRGPWDGSSVSNKDDLPPPVAASAPSSPVWPAPESPAALERNWSVLESPAAAVRDRSAPKSPAAVRDSGAPFPRGAFAPKPDDESTRVAPLAGAPSPASPFGPGVAPPVDSGGYEPRNGNTSPVVPIPIPLSAAAPPPGTQGKTLGERVKADWYATSLPKRILFVLSPLVVASYFSLLFGDDDKKGNKGDSASGSSSGVATTSVPPQPSLDAAGMGFVPSSGVTAAPTASPPPQVGPPLDAGKKGATTLERAAADAYAQGNLPLALLLYERLDRERPGNPAIEQAVRVLRERLDAGR